MPPTTDDLQALRRAAEQRGDAAATHWEQERRARMEEAIQEMLARRKSVFFGSIFKAATL